MFPDDTKLFISDEKIGELFQQINKKLKCVSSCFKANKLSININKTKWTTFYPPSRKCFMPRERLELFINGKNLKRETVTIFLGVFIDELSHGTPILTQFPPRFLKA